jgi:DNA-binding CsgD family transcriptional regulator
MDLRLIINYLLSVGLALYIIYIGYQLYRNFQFRFLLIYLYYLIAVSVYGFFAWTGEFISGCLFEAGQITQMNALKPLVCLIAYPFIPLSVYLFILLIRELLNKRVSLLHKSVYWSLWILVSLGVLLISHEFLHSQSQHVFSVLHRTAGILMLIFRYMILSHLFFHLRAVKNDPKYHMVRFFGFYYLTAFSLYFVATHFAPNVFAFNFAWPLVFFSLNLPPLLVMRHYLYCHQIDQYLGIDSEVSIKQFYTRYRISSQEQNIIQLLFSGKSNREIGDLLFISTGTIKNYTSNIYKKIGVKDRHQLVNLIRNLHLLK